MTRADHEPPTDWALTSRPRWTSTPANTPGSWQQVTPVEDEIEGLSERSLPFSPAEPLARLTRTVLFVRSGCSARVATALAIRGARGLPGAHGPTGDEVVVLVGAKAHPGEFSGGDLAATDPDSIATITKALNHAPGQLDAAVAAVFVHALFANDLSHKASSAATLITAAHAAHEALGLAPRALDGWAATFLLASTG